MKRGSWVGILCRIAACLPFVLCATALLVSHRKPLAGAYLSADRMYAHFLVDGQFVMLRGDYAGWMIERKWRDDAKAMLNRALQNQQATFNFWDTRDLQDRVGRSTPPPELTETLAQEATLFFLGKSKPKTHWGVLTRGTYWPPRTGTPLKIDAIGIRRLVELSTFPVFVVAVLYCIGARRQARRQRCNACLSCGYSLVGNTSGVCPECGTPIVERGQTSEPVQVVGPKPVRRPSRFGLIVWFSVCLPPVAFAAILVLDRVKPEVGAYLSADRMYAHFLIDGRFVAIRGDYADWMIREQWRKDTEKTYRVAQQSQQKPITHRGQDYLWDRVERSVPKPELTEPIARQLTGRLFALAIEETYAGVVTHYTFRPPRATGLLTIDAIALMPLAGLSAVPLLVLAAMGCVRTFQRRRSRRLGVCPSCGSVLSDCDDGVCPACGTLAKAADPTQTGNET